MMTVHQPCRRHARVTRLRYLRLVKDDLVELFADEACAGTPAAFGKILEARERATEAFRLHKARLLDCADSRSMWQETRLQD